MVFHPTLLCHSKMFSYLNTVTSWKDACDCFSVVGKKLSSLNSNSFSIHLVGNNKQNLEATFFSNVLSLCFLVRVEVGVTWLIPNDSKNILEYCETICQLIELCFSAFLKLQPSNTVLHALETPCHKIIFIATT